MIEPEELVLRYAHETAPEIGEDLGFSESAVRRYLKRLNVNKEYAIRYASSIAIEPTTSEKAEAKREMIDGFYRWALSHKVRGGRKVIRKILDILEDIPDEEVSVEDDGTFQIGTGTYSVDRQHRAELIKLRYNPNQRRLDIYMRDKLYS